MVWRIVPIFLYLFVTVKSSGGEVLQKPVDLLVQPTHICTKDTKLLIVVHSAMRNFGRRQTIRETYGQESLKRKFKFDVLFAMGVEKEKSSPYDNWVKDESDRFNDILQGQLIDSYNNMTTKALMWMRYARDNCDSTDHILHLDDDIMIDIFSIMDAYHIGKLFKEAIYCLLKAHDNDLVVRDTKSKWFIPKSLYEKDEYPPFCSGAAYLLPSRAVGLLVEDVERRKYMLVDDVLITGIARDAIRLDIYATNPSGRTRQTTEMAIETFNERKAISVECASEICMHAIFKSSVTPSRLPIDITAEKVSSRSPIPMATEEVREVKKRPSILVITERWLHFWVFGLLLVPLSEPLLKRGKRLIRRCRN